MEHLAKSGIPVWYDRSLGPGDRWSQVIRQRIEESRAVIVLMTPAFEASEWSDIEIGHAEATTTQIFPLLLSGEPLFRLSQRQFEDVRDGSWPSEAFVRRLRAVVAPDAPGDPADLHQRSVALWEDGRHAEALELADRVIELAPHRAEGHANRALYLKSLRRLDEALAAIDRSLEIDPSRPLNHFNRGLILADLQRFGDAVAAYDSAIALDPNRAPYHYRRANTLGELGRYEDALASIDRTLELDPGNENALRTRRRLLQLLHP